MSQRTTSRAFLNGRIHTMGDALPEADAVVTALDRIVYVGSGEGARRQIGPQTEVVDLHGACVVPGFTDSHTHLMLGGTSLLSVDLGSVRSTAEFRNTLRTYVAQHPNNWVTGGNWNHENWESNDLPHKEWIDPFTSDTPVFVSRMDYHMALANSCALRLAGITGDTPDPEGGLIVRDPRTQEPTGVLKDKAMELVERAIPEPSEQELERRALAALQEARRLGVTTVHDILLRSDFRTLQALRRKGALTCRVFGRLPIDMTPELVRAGVGCPFGDPLLSIGSMKAFADGSLGSSTALFFEPYNDDPASRGLAMDVVTDGRLRTWALEADRNHLQLSIHAIGDRANAMMLDLCEEILRTNPPWDRRLRIEHAQHVRPRDLARFARLGVIVSAQPYHLYDDGAWAEAKIGADRLPGMYAFGSFLRSGASVCFGSDWPVVTLDPLAGIWAAVTRQTAGNSHPNGLVPEERITVEQAVRCYTMRAAYAAFQERDLGSIEPGKLADMTVLSEDIFSIPAEAIRNVRTMMTILGGEIIFGQP